MIGIRFQLATVGLFLFGSAVLAQEPETRQGIPEPVTLTSPYQESGHVLSDESWPELAEDDLVHGELSYESVEFESAPCSTCQCGAKHCHGVCTDPGRPRKPFFDKPGDRNRGDCPPKRYLMHDCKRAGNPHCVAWWAECSVDGKYSSWFVGGGSPFARGRCRKPTEGTWGLDYNGFFGHAKVWMNYTRYNRNQGGEGAYETDGEPAFVSKAHQILHLGH